LFSCTKEEYKIPDPISSISNDCIKRTLGPNIASLPIEFVYAMAIPKSKGKLVSAEVEASIEGASGTYLEHRSYYTASNGADVPVSVAFPNSAEGKFSRVTFNVDTNAASLRYFYIVPAAAQGQEVSFTFRVKGSDGSTASYKMGPYKITKMDIKRTIAVSNNNMAYISIADMAVYNAANAATNAAKIDLVYLYRSSPSSFLHGLVSPGSDPVNLPGVTLPAGVNRKSKLQKTFNLQDRNLAQLQFGVYVDEKDFQEINLSNAADYATGLKAEAGVWVETQDGKYRAYIFVNSVNANGSAVISMLRYPL
jgi:hypothetical protein